MVIANVSTVWHWLQAVPTRVWLGIGGVSAALFLGSLAAVPWLVGRLPETYFLHDTDPPGPDRHPVIAWLRTIVKNLIGFVLLLAGIAMLVLPGQGILTILLGVSLLDFPGRRACQHFLLTRPLVFKALNWLRTKENLPPFVAPKRRNGR